MSRRATLVAWWRGETPRQREKQLSILEHPWRYGALASVIWGALMFAFWIGIVGPGGHVLIFLCILAPSSALFGFLTIRGTHRKFR